jgi:AbrB family looped-hinge helix DNA binding protein
MKSVAVKVSDAGRLTLPAEVRRTLGLKGPGHVVLTLEDGVVRLSTMRQEIERVRELARPYKPKGRLASEELIAERRAAARKE